ncbi:MAG: hypothetical protein ACRDPW_11095, partial [Mycobacteriales bacterium]
MLVGTDTAQAEHIQTHEATGSASRPQVSRRGVICSVAGACVGAAAVGTGLTACGSSDSGGDNGSDTADDPSVAAPAPQQGQP